MEPRPNRPSHLRALLKKNWILYTRSWCGSILEILVPLLFAVLMLAFRGASPVSDVAQTTYYNPTPPPIYPYSVTADNALGLTDLPYIKNCNAAKNGGKIALAPGTDDIIKALDVKFRAANYKTQIFDNNQQIDEFTSRLDYTQDDLNLCFGIVMTKANQNNKYEYLLRWNTSSSQDIPDPNSKRIKPISIANLDSLTKYATSGFLVVQNLIDNIILQSDPDGKQLGTADIKATVTSRTVEAYKKDDLATGLKGQSRLFLDLPLLLPYLRFINNIVREKEKRIREGMKIMGLKNSAFYFAWFITYFIIFSLISILVSLVLVGGFFKNSALGWVFLWHWEFSMCLMAMGFLVTVFFNKAKIGNVAGFVLVLLLGFVQQLGGDDAPATRLFFMSIAPQASLGLGADHILNLEAAQLGLTSQTVNLDVQNYKIIYHYIWMFIDTVVFLLLGSYLDQVLPSEFGIRKHPCFCLMRKKKRSAVLTDRDENKSMLDNPENYEEADPNLKAQDDNAESIMVKNMKKVFGNGKVAVDGVSFNMYQGQIFVLLGHNGAGKTTTISMITGLFNPSKGTVKAFGRDIRYELEEVRKTMGVCPQHDILFDSLTVQEHLELYAVFKGVPSKEIKPEVEKIIEDIGLSDKKDYLSKNLSGGQKRKLSVGIAFIGGSKFILLDEPSSGMDTSARRRLWEMLKNYKNNRVVLLTTHFMDEADYLGDRIGIMGEGKLKCLGSSLFLKTKFGVGYNLTMIKKNAEVPDEPIRSLVKTHVPENTTPPPTHTSAELEFQLPIESASKFKGLFDNLDSKLEKLGIITYGISVTTLEEVFLRIAEIAVPEKHFQKQIELTGFVKDEIEDFSLHKDRIKGTWNLFSTHFKALVVKRFHYIKRDKRGLCCELFLPIIMVIAGILIAKADFFKPIVPLPLTDNLYGYKFDVQYNEYVPPSTALDTGFLNEFSQDNFNLIKDWALTPAKLDENFFIHQGKDILRSSVNVFSFFVNKFDLTNDGYEYVAFVDTRAQEAAPFALNKINTAILRRATGVREKDINVIVAPFQRTKGTETIENVIDGTTYAFVFSIGMSFIPASVITFIVKERENNVKHQQVVSGVSITAYWFANYFVDILKYMVPGVVNSLIAMAFNATALIDGPKLGGLWAVFMLYGFCIISFVYLTSFLFRDYGTAQITSFFFNFGTGFIGGLAVSILRVFQDTRTVSKILMWILRVLPTFAMTLGFLNLSNREIYALTEQLKVPLDVFDMTLVGGDILYLAVGGVVYLALVFLVEILRTKQFFVGILSRENRVPYVPKQLDQDVEAEMETIETSDNQTYAIKVDKLRKVYAVGRGKHKVAVDRLSFGVKNGECFALLGVNGAGKTTTFKILSGDYLQTSGKAYINGFEVPNQLAQARHDIGYCPQFDALLENLTAKEHLYLYAAVKGIPVKLRGRFVEKQLREMNLKQYENVPAGTYSGGNKRKLSVAIAMIGNPPVVFLDEPSTGMDPEARKFMRNVISRISKESKLSSIILTTHSMEEAEALATRIGIMVSGNLKCLGSSQHIKSKYGGGYEIEVKLNLPTREQVKSMASSLELGQRTEIEKEELDTALGRLGASDLKGEVSEAGSGSAIHTELKKGRTSVNLLVEWVLIEKNGQKLKDFLKRNVGEFLVLEHFQSFFRFKTTGAVGIGKFFGSMEDNKKDLNIMQYSIRQSTIEQIFNAFAAEEAAKEAAQANSSAINIEEPRPQNT